MKADIRAEILDEVLTRSTSAAIGFLLVALLSIATGMFSITYPGYIRILCAGVVVMNLTRMWIVQRCKRRGVGLDKYWNLFVSTTGLNGLLWGISFALSVLDAFAPQWALSLCLAIYFAFCNASILTLGNSQRLQTSFILGISIPLFLSSSWRFITDGETFYLVLCFIIVTTIIYALTQGLKYRRRFEEKWRTDTALLKSQQDLIEQRAMTEHVNRLSSIGEMAAGFAHEINNPLAIVIGNLEILESELTDKKLLDQQTERLISKTITSASRIAKIIKGLRTLSRASSREGMTSTTLEEILQDTVVLYEQRFATFGIKLTIDNRANRSFMCDPIQIGQVLVNLISNACDEIIAHTDENRWINIMARSEQDQITVEVSNSGPAISNENKAKIFTPFFTTKPVGQGMGLGLVISRSIALQHGGSLDVSNDQGFTCFRLTLPLHSQSS